MIKRSAGTFTELNFCIVYAICVDKNEEAVGRTTRAFISMVTKLSGITARFHHRDVVSNKEALILIPDFCPMSWHGAVRIDEAVLTGRLILETITTLNNLFGAFIP